MPLTLRSLLPLGVALAACVPSSSRQNGEMLASTGIPAFVVCPTFCRVQAVGHTAKRALCRVSLASRSATTTHTANRIFAVCAPRDTRQSLNFPSAVLGKHATLDVS
jgi:hypothetical protein